MTPDEWRKKHKMCGNCIYFCEHSKADKEADISLSDGLCTVKSRDKVKTLIRFCKVYKAKKFELQKEKSNVLQ